MEDSILTALSTSFEFTSYLSNLKVGGKVLTMNTQDCRVDFISSSNKVCNINIGFNNLTCFVLFVYAKCNIVERRELWDDPMRFGGNIVIPWLVGGDFNVVMQSNERLGCSSDNSLAMLEFNTFVVAAGL